MSNHNVTILCSGVASGVYIPGIALHKKLTSHGIQCKTFIIENLISENKINRIGKQPPAEQVAVTKSKECRRQSLQVRRILVDMDHLQSRSLNGGGIPFDSENKKAFHQNFKLTLLVQRMNTDFNSNIDADLLNNLFCIWKEEEIQEFIVLSGFWIPIIEKYNYFCKKLIKKLCRKYYENYSF